MSAKLAAYFIALTLAAGSGSDDRKARAALCKKTKEEIRQVQSKLRSGYTRARGENLEARLRELREKRKRNC